MQRFRAVIVVAYCMAVAGPAVAGPSALKPVAGDSDDVISPDRPGIADSSTVVGRRKFQIEVGLQHEYRTDLGSSEHTWFVPTLLRLGLNDQWEARIETNGYTFDRLYAPGMGTNRTDGYAPVSIGIKGHWQESKGPAQPSLGAILRVFPASGSGAFRSSHSQYDIRFAADWDFAPNWTLNPNLGFGTYEDGSGQVFTAGLFAVTLNRVVNRRVQAFADIAFQSPGQATEARVAAILDGGLTYLLSKNRQLDVSAGTGVSGHSPPHPFWSIGYSRRF